MKRISILFVFIFSIVFMNCGGSDTPKGGYAKKDKADTPKVEETKETKTAKQDPNATVIPPEELAKAKEIIAGVKDADIAAVDAKGKFNMFCAVCHGKTGNLNVNGAKDLTVSKISLEESVAQVYHGRGLMTPFRGILKDHEIVAVSKYIASEIRQ